jgi:hypothetical protein
MCKLELLGLEDEKARITFLNQRFKCKVLQKIEGAVGRENIGQDC